MRGAFALGLALTFVAGAGCRGGSASEPRPCEPMIEIALEAAALINPSEEGQALPVVIRVYQLRELNRFTTADLGTLARADETLLGTDLLERSDRTLFPAERTMLRLPRRPEARYFAVMALFRHANGTTWGHAYTLPDSEVTRRVCKAAEEAESHRPRIARVVLRVQGTRITRGENKG